MSDEIRKNRAMFYKEDLVKFQKNGDELHNISGQETSRSMPIRLEYPMVKGVHGLLTVGQFAVKKKR